MQNEMNYIYTIYKEKSFSKAAKKLFISQPALSTMVKKIESKIGSQIFDRDTVPLTITSEGEYYIKSVERILAIEKDIEKYFNDLKNLESGTLVIGGSSFFCAFILPKLIDKFQHKYPKIKIETVEANINDLIDELNDGSVDLIIETAISPKDKTLDTHLYGEEYILLSVPKKWEINNNLKEFQLTFEDVKNKKYLDNNFPPVDLKLFKKCPFISMKKGNDQYNRGINMCKKAGFIPKTIFQIDQILTGYHIAVSTESAALFVRSNLVSNVYKNNDALIYYKLGDELAKRPIFIASKKNQYISHATKKFLEMACNKY